MQKHIWLVRHAESTNNVSKRAAAQTLGKGKLPSTGQWSEILSMLKVNMDTPLSEAGQKQVSAQRALLDNQVFVASNNIELVVHSHLQRACETCMGLFAGSPGIDGIPRPKIEEHPELYEKSIGEHLWLSKLGPRVDSFVQWLLDRPEQRICVVGHSAFFRAMVNDRFGNCEIKHALLAADGTWGELACAFKTPSIDVAVDEDEEWSIVGGDIQAEAAL
mmetsp:Transcript_58817/g.102942  ORF Transcript_58817/g.102942 Transcript_58817/m.102942 type:complete len:219 (-) Transcript_58817:141-797(-)